MNFTREPIIETVITPKEGCKLVVRSSKGASPEDYFVDAVEVVSFGSSLFFRSQERPKSFLVPVGDYEVLELKETRMVLKHVAADRSIKIGGGKDSSQKPREEAQEKSGSSDEAPLEEAHKDRKRDKRRRGRRNRDRHDPRRQTAPKEEEEMSQSQDVSQEGEAPEKAPSFISKLFPPPQTLIKETLSRHKIENPPEEQSRSDSAPEQDEDEE